MGGTWFWNRYPGRPLRLRELHLRLPVLEGAVRRVGVAGALRRPARDRALPQPRRRPLRPPPPHALRRVGHRRRVRRAVGHVGGDARRRQRDRGPASSSPPPGVLSVPYLPDVPGRDDFRGDAAPHRSVAGRAGRLRRQAGRGHRHVVERRAGASRRSSTTSPQVTVYQRTANWCTPLNNTPITADEQAAAAGRLRGPARGAEHVDQRLPPPGERAGRVRRLARGAPGVLRADVEQPGLHEAHEQLRRPAVQRGRQRRVVRVHRRQDPRHRRRPGDRRAADPERPPLRREAPAVRHRLLRGVQRPERLARRPARRRRWCG